MKNTDLRIALAGNPNVGKSTLFNALTGMRQHTGNWPGKTVELAEGIANYQGKTIKIVDLPGTYSLSGSTEDERIAAEFIAREPVDWIVAVCDGSCLERSLILPLQIMQRTNKVILCVNLMDEAKARGISIDSGKLTKFLKIPVVLMSAGRKRGIRELLEFLTEPAEEENPLEISDALQMAEDAVRICVHYTPQEQNWRMVLDRVLVSRRYGVPIMLFLLFFMVWLTVWGANYPSRILQDLLNRLYHVLLSWTYWMPYWLSGILVDGVYATTAQVIAVMLPPMAIFFPLFTILEDIGYLPRMAFLLDRPMCRCGGCGKQALTMCIGLGCNCVGITGCRILDSPRERLLAILTNAMIPCNGRFPTLILLGSLFFPGVGSPFVVAACIMLGVLAVMGTSTILSKTVLKHEESTFLMEIPPFRRPRFLQILVRSLVDRTLHIALRAVRVAAPAGAVLWILGEFSLLEIIGTVLDPLGYVLGMNGVILLGFLCALPANELLIPVILMTLSGSGNLQETAGIGTEALLAAGWTWQTALCTMAFTLFHWPCSTALLTIYKETRSKRKTAVAFILPTAVGVLLCMMLHLVLREFGG